MSNRRIRFVSSNPFKLAEAEQILGRVGIDVLPVNFKIEKLQTTDTEALVRDKTLKAFSRVGHRLFVEHTGLYVKYLNEFPGGLTQCFWDALQADRFSELLGNTPNTSVVARTMVGYVDGQRLHFFTGEVSGSIASEPRGSRDFQWDCVFIPEGQDATFAELGQKKNDISMRRMALDELASFLAKE